MITRYWLIALLAVALVLTACARPPRPVAPAQTPAGGTPASPAWKSYSNATLGIAFEYPAVYDEAANKDMCAVRTIQDGVGMGIRSEFAAIDPGGRSLDDFASELVKTKEFTEESRAAITVGGQPALTVEYRFGGPNRYGTFTLVAHNGRTYAFNFSAGAVCDFPEAGVAELDAYHHWLATFQFQK